MYEVCTVLKCIYDRTHPRALTGFEVIPYNLQDRQVNIRWYNIDATGRFMTQCQQLLQVRIFEGNGNK